jgi:hypothetical protein
MFKKLQSEQVLPMNNFPNPNPSFDTTSNITELCNHCKINPAETYQEDGEFCLPYWQEITCPNV